MMRPLRISKSSMGTPVRWSHESMRQVTPPREVVPMRKVWHPGRVGARYGRQVPGGRRGVRIGLVVLVGLAMLVGACAPARVWDTHTTSTSRPEPPRMAELAHEPVATFSLLAPAS